ncbi:unnamed protein product [Cylindrotheca closterium]|uniref:Uncharacterized protein n=1 Tax=Cylindrotheca closterium TaxID=2856 RepID=A0AAD2CDY3_9STRA|nr:unnamed protein product [Cylindrotheca closterium]
MMEEEPSPPIELPSKGRSRKERRQKPSSEAKQRMEKMAVADKNIAFAFVAVFLLSAGLTTATILHLETEFKDSSNPVFSAMSKKLAAYNRVPIHKKKPADAPKPWQEPVKMTAKQQESELAFAEPSIRQQDLKDQHEVRNTFPVHASHDLEEIDHPGIFFADPHQFQAILHAHPDLPASGKILVPKFWRPSGYGEGGVRHFLGENGKRLPTLEEAKAIGSTFNSHETIYISVASYRDPECQPTVEDMFLRATHPERLRIAIIDQRAEDDEVSPCAEPTIPCDEDPEQTLCKYGHLVDSFAVSAPLSVGPVFARHLANRMYRGEYFAMQVDSHVRFIEGWDTSIVDQWRQANNEMAVLSVYLSDITDSIDPVTFENRHPMRPIMCKTDYEGEGKMKHLRHGQQPEGLPGIHGEPTLHPFWAAGFSFARGHFVVQVPYDQYQPMVFQGEEIFQGLRSFTYGYDIYAPEISVAFHMYAIKENAVKRKKVKLFWENGKLFPGSGLQAMKRLNGIIGLGDPGDTYYHKDEEEYGLGGVRSKEKFFSLYGIHPDTKTVEDHLLQRRHEKQHEMKQHTTELVTSLLLPSWIDLRHIVTSRSKGHPMNHVDIIDGDNYGRCEAVGRLQSAMRHCKLQYLVLSEIEIDEDVAKALVDLLKASQRDWEALYMEFCIGKLDQAMRSVMELDTVRRIEVTGTLSQNCMHAISDGLRGCKALRELSLYTTLDSENTSILILGLDANTGLRALRLVKSTIKKEAVEELTRFFRRNRRLKSVALDRCISSEGGMVNILDSLSELSTLEELSIAGVLLTSSTLSAISKLTAKNALEKLTLQDNKANGRIGMEQFFKSGALSDKNSLRILDLSRSKINDSNLKVLVETIRKNSTLEEVRLEHNCITDAGAVFLGSRMHLMKGVRRIFLHKNEINEAGLRAILQGTRRSHRVHEITVTVVQKTATLSRIQVLINYETCLNAAGRHLLQDRDFPMGLWPRVFERAGKSLFSPYSTSQMKNIQCWRKIQQTDVIFRMLRHLDIGRYANGNQANL